MEKRSILTQFAYIEKKKRNIFIKHLFILPGKVSRTVWKKLEVDIPRHIKPSGERRERGAKAENPWIVCATA